MLIKEIYKKFNTPLHVIAHMEAVKNVCEKLSNLTTETLDTKSLFTAALIHDALRVCDFVDLDPKKFPYEVSDEDMKIWKEIRKKYGAIGHAKALHDYLLGIDEPILANLVMKHDFNQVGNLKTLEEKILYYADKRVEKDRVISLDSRLEAGRIRNYRGGADDEERENLIKQIHLLEEQLADKLGDRVYSL